MLGLGLRLLRVDFGGVVAAGDVMGCFWGIFYIFLSYFGVTVLDVVIEGLKCYGVGLNCWLCMDMDMYM